MVYVVFCYEGVIGEMGIVKIDTNHLSLFY